MRSDSRVSWNRTFFGRRIPVLVVVAILALIVGLLASFDALFEEPSARRVDSLVADLGCRSILAIFAHPDDELLVAATLADATKRGAVVRTISATRGEAGIPGGFSGSRSDLARLREAELRRFGHVLGVQDQALWDFPDGNLSGVPPGVLRDSVLIVIHRYEPDLILTLDSTAGFTGHSDHRRIGRAVTEAAMQIRGSREGKTETNYQPRWLAWIICPRRMALLVPRELSHRLREQPPAEIAATGNLQMKLVGMRAHATQRRYLPPPWLRPVLYRLWDKEHFAVVRLSAPSRRR